jgi:hypothetical protein
MVESVCCAVRTYSLYTADYVSSLKRQILLMLEITDPQLFSVFHNDANNHVSALNKHQYIISIYGNE